MLSLNFVHSSLCDYFDQLKRAFIEGFHVMSYQANFACFILLVSFVHGPVLENTRERLVTNHLFHTTIPNHN